MNPTSAPLDYAIPEDLWESMRGVLPAHVNTHRFGGGRPRKADRVCMNAIFYVLKTGCQWRALDTTGICPGSTAHDRFKEWVEAGVFMEFWRTGLFNHEYFAGLDWSWLGVDDRHGSAGLEHPATRRRTAGGIRLRTVTPGMPLHLIAGQAQPQAVSST